MSLQVNYLLSDERTSARALHESAEEIAPRLSKLLSALPACTLTATPEFLEKFPGTKALKMQFEAPVKVEVTGPLLFDVRLAASAAIQPIDPPIGFPVLAHKRPQPLLLKPLSSSSFLPVLELAAHCGQADSCISSIRGMLPGTVRDASQCPRFSDVPA